MILVKYSKQNHLKPYFYFALEEYILKHLLKDDEAYYFTWKIKGVVIGKHQVIENEVNLNFLKENNIDIYRRPTGGGTIYADENNTMYSMITKKSNNFSFKPYLELIIDAVDELGVKLEFSGRNDLLYDGKKFSGVSFLENRFGFLIHGTFMYDVDINTLVRAITPDDEKLVSKGIESVRSRVVNLKDHLKGVSEEELFKHIENKITNEVYVLSAEEEKIIEQMAEKYESESWRFIKQPPYTKILEKRIAGGKFIIHLNLNKGIIKDIKFSGDFFDILPISIVEESLKGQIYQKENIEEILKGLNIESVLLDVKEEEFIDLVISGVIN